MHWHIVKDNIRLTAVMCLIFINLIINSAFSKELINNFNSHIVIEKNGQITVTETIAVTAENRLINRGIYRDFRHSILLLG